jgi:hypothetical protein
MKLFVAVVFVTAETTNNTVFQDVKTHNLAEVDNAWHYISPLQLIKP